MTSSRQFGSKKAAVGNTYSIFTPTGIVTRLSDTVDSTVFAIDKQSASSRSILTSTFYSLVLGIPLKMCRFVLTQMETLLGVKHRPIVSVQRRSLKTRRSSSGRKSTSDKMNDECCDHETSLNGSAVKFDFKNSPDASKKMLNVISPNKRRTSALMSQNESTIDEEEEKDSSCDEDSSDDEVIDHIKLLNQSDVNYKSEEDSDFDPNDSERRDQAERDDYEDMNTSCDSEPPFEQVPQKSPCLTDHSVVELSFNEEGYDAEEVKTAELCQVPDLISELKTDDSDLNGQELVAEEKEMPLKSTENFADMDQNGNQFLEKKKIEANSEVDQENEPHLVA
ncbi:uncharacterized protein LOC142339037 [Convolutriloba macropyga]|uniref:uncharacterized protein LOC142339037 n=1 Tax=Convolutriloba macropyga TaxID=536237 RepID=UPI003F520B76